MTTMNITDFWPEPDYVTQLRDMTELDNLAYLQDTGHPMSADQMQIDSDTAIQHLYQLELFRRRFPVECTSDDQSVLNAYKTLCESGYKAVENCYLEPNKYPTDDDLKQCLIDAGLYGKNVSRDFVQKFAAAADDISLHVLPTPDDADYLWSNIRDERWMMDPHDSILCNYILGVNVPDRQIPQNGYYAEGFPRALSIVRLNPEERHGTWLYKQGSDVVWPVADNVKPNCKYYLISKATGTVVSGSNSYNELIKDITANVGYMRVNPVGREFVTNAFYAKATNDGPITAEQFKKRFNLGHFDLYYNEDVTPPVYNYELLINGLYTAFNHLSDALNIAPEDIGLNGKLNITITNSGDKPAVTQLDDNTITMTFPSIDSLFNVSEPWFRAMDAGYLHNGGYDDVFLGSLTNFRDSSEIVANKFHDDGSFNTNQAKFARCGAEYVFRSLKEQGIRDPICATGTFSYPNVYQKHRLYTSVPVGYEGRVMARNMTAMIRQMKAKHIFHEGESVDYIPVEHKETGLARLLSHNEKAGIKI